MIHAASMPRPSERPFTADCQYLYLVFVAFRIGTGDKSPSILLLDRFDGAIPFAGFAKRPTASFRLRRVLCRLNGLVCPPKMRQKIWYT